MFAMSKCYFMPWNRIDKPTNQESFSIHKIAEIGNFWYI